LAFHGVANDGAWPVAGRSRSRFERALQLSDIVAIALEHLEAEASPLVGQRLHVLDLEHAASRLDLVVVDDRREMRQAMLVGAGRRLPDRALVDLAVPHQHVDLAVAPLHAGRQGHAYADRQAVAQRTGASLDPGHDGFRVTAEDRVEATEAVELLDGKEA